MSEEKKNEEKTEVKEVVKEVKTEIKEKEVEAPAIKTSENYVKELEGLLKDTIGVVKTQQEQTKEALAAYQEASKRGFPIPNVEESGTTKDDEAEIYAPYNMAKQGKRLMEKFVHPKYQIADDAVREEVAKYFVLLYKASQKNARPKDVEMFWDKYSGKTAVGDSGNVFPVPDIVDTELFAFTREKSVALQYCRIWEMTSEKMSFPAETASSSVSWGNTTSSSDPTVSEVELTANELSAYTTVKNMTLADSRTDIVSWLTEEMAEAAGLELDNQVFNGTGDPVSGILTAACGYSVAMDSGSTAFSLINDTKLSAMIAELDGLKKEGARFWFHGQILHYVRTLKDSQNRPIFYESLGHPTSGTILGFPYTEVIKAPETSAAATAFVNFGNLKYFAIGRRLGSTSLEVDPYGLWTTNRTRFKIYQRWGLNIALANGFVRLITAAS